MRYLIAALALLISIPLAAQEKPISVTPITTHLDGVACNAAAGARTFDTDIGKLGPNGQSMPLVVFEVYFTHNAATAIGLACSVSSDNGATWLVPQDAVSSAGVSTLSDASWSKAVAANKNFPMRWDSTGFLKARCVWSCTGGGATDTVILKSYKTTK